MAQERKWGSEDHADRDRVHTTVRKVADDEHSCSLFWSKNINGSSSPYPEDTRRLGTCSS